MNLERQGIFQDILQAYEDVKKLRVQRSNSDDFLNSQSENNSDGNASYYQSELDEHDEGDVLIYFIKEVRDGIPMIYRWEEFLEDVLDGLTENHHIEIYKLLNSVVLINEQIEGVLDFVNELMGINLHYFSRRCYKYDSEYYDSDGTEEEINHSYTEKDYDSDSDSIDSEYNLDYYYHKTKLSDAEIEFTEDVDSILNEAQIVYEQIKKSKLTIPCKQTRNYANL